MLFSALTTVIYLITSCSQSCALPAAGTNARDLGLGLEQTTQRYRQTTTIDYDLADFDEFGTDPGIYDTAASPDVINMADDNDQGPDTGQSLFEPLNFFTTGAPPTGSGGISSEVKETVEKKSEGGPADEGVYGSTDKQQSSVTDKHIPNKIGTEADLDQNNKHNIGSSENSASETQLGTMVQSKGESFTSQYKAADPDSSENNRIFIDDKTRQKGRTNGKGEISANKSYDANYRSDPNVVGLKTPRNETGISQQIPFAKDFTNSEHDETSTEVGSYENKSGTSVEIGISNETSSELGGYSVHDSKSMEDSAGSKSQSTEDSGVAYTEEVYSVEVVSGENFGEKIETNTRVANNSSSYEDSAGSHELDRSWASSFESSTEETGVHSSDENLYDSSDDTSNNLSLSSVENGLQQTSVETGPVSDENISDSISDEAGTISSDDESKPRLPESGSRYNSSEMSDSYTSFSSDNDVDNDHDHDKDNGSNENEANFSGQPSTEKEISEKGNTVASPGKGASVASVDVYDSTEDRNMDEASSEPGDNLADCFLSSQEEGEYCQILRSLYAICRTKFKQECTTHLDGKRKEMNDKPSSRYKSLTSSSPAEVSSESVELFPDSEESSFDGSSVSTKSTYSAMTVESVENLSASFEKSTGMFEIIKLIRNACEGICDFAESSKTNKEHTVHSGTDPDIDSSESSDENDLIGLSGESFPDSDEDQTETWDLSQGTSSENKSSEAISVEVDLSGMSSGENSVESISNEPSLDESFASLSSTENMYSVDSSGDRSFDYSKSSENVSD